LKWYYSRDIEVPAGKRRREEVFALETRTLGRTGLERCPFEGDIIGKMKRAGEVFEVSG